MALTIEQEPSEPILTGNPAFVEVSTDKRVLTVGSKAEITFSYATQLPAGSHGTLQWGGQEYRFDIVPVPDDSGFQLPEFNDPPSFDIFIQALQDNYYINRDFEVIVTSPTPTFQYKLVARENGAAYSVIVVSSLNWGTGAPTAGVDDEIAENFTAAGMLFVKQGSDFVNVAKLSGYWNDEDLAKIYLNHVLDSFVGLTLPPIAFPGADVGRWTREMPEMVAYYYAELREFYGTPPTFKNPTEWGTVGSPKRAARIQLTKTEFENNTVAADYFTHASGVKLISDVTVRKSLATQTDYFYVHFDGGNPGDHIYSRVDVYYTDGTTSMANDVSNYQLVSARANGFLEFALDWPRVLTNNAAVGKTIERMDVYASSTHPGPSVSSSKVSVYFDHVNHEHTHYFIFRNRFNGWSTIAFTGALKKIVSSKNDTAVLGDYSTNEFGDEFTYNHHYQYGYEVGTGLWEKQYNQQIIEFMNSDRIYILDGDWGSDVASFRPVIIDTKGLSNIETTESYTFAGKFSFTNANREI